MGCLRIAAFSIFSSFSRPLHYLGWCKGMVVHPACVKYSCTGACFNLDGRQLSAPLLHCRQETSQYHIGRSSLTGVLPPCAPVARSRYRTNPLRSRRIKAVKAFCDYHCRQARCGAVQPQHVQSWAVLHSSVLSSRSAHT